jgi:hypothetical protein
MISSSYRRHVAERSHHGSRKTSPQSAFRRNWAFPIVATTVLKILTVRFPRQQNASDFSSVSRAFPGDGSHFDPVFPHLNAHQAAKRFLKSLTFDQNHAHFSSGGSRESLPPGFPHLCQ